MPQACPTQFKTELEQLTKDAIKAVNGTKAQKTRVINKLIAFMKQTPNPACADEDKTALGLIMMLKFS